MSEEKHLEQMSMLPANLYGEAVPADQASDVPYQEAYNVFRRDEEDAQLRELINKHRSWLDSFKHEYPLPYRHYRIGVYIRYFNQTKYENYLDYHKKQFEETISECPNWELIDFYKTLGQFRRSSSVFASGDFIPVYAQNAVFAFIRKKGKSAVLTAVNSGNASAEIEVPSEYRGAKPVFGGKAENGRLKIGPRDFAILAL